MTEKRQPHEPRNILRCTICGDRVMRAFSPPKLRHEKSKHYDHLPTLRKPTSN